MPLPLLAYAAGLVLTGGFGYKAYKKLKTPPVITLDANLPATTKQAVGIALTTTNPQMIIKSRILDFATSLLPDFPKAHQALINRANTLPKVKGSG